MIIRHDCTGERSSGSVDHSAVDSLQRLDETGTEDIFVELPPRDPEWEAVHDRLKKASTWA